MNSAINKSRLKYELLDIKKYPQFKVNVDPKNNNIWFVSFKGAEKTLYENENFTLRFEFDAGYVINNLNFFNNIFIAN